jgi:ribosomal protein S18 acetylase RimI-like enzyme
MTKPTGDIALRPATSLDARFLSEMLYYAIYVPPGSPPPPREIVRHPELSCYVDGWGRPGDMGFIATVNNRPVGAAWVRLLTGDGRGYGYVDDQTPELSLAVRPSHRGQGIGSQLLTQLLGEAAHRYRAVSLSVSANNPARQLYERHGFIVTKVKERSLTMLRHFDGPLWDAAITST